VWCSRVLKDQLSGDILSHWILKESSKWTWWWYLYPSKLSLSSYSIVVYKPLFLSLQFASLLEISSLIFISRS